MTLSFRLIKNVFLLLPMLSCIIACTKDDTQTIGLGEFSVAFSVQTEGQAKTSSANKPDGLEISMVKLKIKNMILSCVTEDGNQVVRTFSELPEIDLTSQSTSSLYTVEIPATRYDQLTIAIEFEQTSETPGIILQGEFTDLVIPVTPLLVELSDVNPIQVTRANVDIMNDTNTLAEIQINPDGMFTNISSAMIQTIAVQNQPIIINATTNVELYDVISLSVDENFNLQILPL